jgi:hypothetical protein
VSWHVEYTEDFGDWWETLDEDEQESVTFVVTLLEERGPTLGFPYSSDVQTSRHRQMRELRVQHQGRPLRILYAFDSRRVALLLLGGDKTGSPRWYEEHVPKADKILAEHLETLKKEPDAGG